MFNEDDMRAGCWFFGAAIAVCVVLLWEAGKFIASHIHFAWRWS